MRFIRFLHTCEECLYSENVKSSNFIALVDFKYRAHLLSRKIYRMLYERYYRVWLTKIPMHNSLDIS